jgi:hypothetical protein
LAIANAFVGARAKGLMKKEIAVLAIANTPATS